MGFEPHSNGKIGKVDLNKAIQGFKSYKGIVQSLREMLQIGRGMLQIGSDI